MRTPLKQLITLARLAPFRNAYVLRGAAVWMIVRVSLAWAKVPDPTAAAEIGLLGMVGFAVWLDARRRAEHVFLGNLGIPAWTIAALALPLALLAEVLVP